jgi:hypothetical protein
MDLFVSSPRELMTPGDQNNSKPNPKIPGTLLQECGESIVPYRHHNGCEPSLYGDRRAERFRFSTKSIRLIPRHISQDNAHTRP